MSGGSWEKFEAGARGVIPSGEPIEAAVWGWAVDPGGTVSILSDTLGLGRLKKGRIFLVSTSQVYLTKARALSGHKSVELLATMDRRGLAVSYDYPGLSIGEHTIVLADGDRYRRAAEAVVAALGAGQ